MSDWKQVYVEPGEALALLQFFSVKKKHASGEIEVRITIHEYAEPEIGTMQFFAMADVELNQKTMPYRPNGWSATLMGALSECLKNMRRFEYEGPEANAANPAQG